MILLALVSSAVMAAPPCLTVAEAQGAAGGSGATRQLTPPLPVRWPPSGPAAVRYFDFRSEPLPTGIVSYAVNSPSTEVTVPLDGAAVSRRALGKSKRLGTFYPPVDPPMSDPAKASAVLLRLVCENRMPTEAEAAELRDGYSGWLRQRDLERGWLSGQAGPFIGWIFSKPLPPPAPPGAKLTARIEGDAVVMNRDGNEVRFEHSGGLRSSQLTVVPLRADGSEPALWVNVTEAKGGPIGMLVRFASPPQVLYTQVYSSSQHGISSTSRQAWLLDVDGDGNNDVVEHSRLFTDTGPENLGPRVFRYDALSGSFAPDGTLDRLAPKSSPHTDSRAGQKLAAQLKVPQVEVRGRLDAYGVRQPSAPAVDTIDGSGTPPFVGPDGVQLVMAKKPGVKFGGQYYLANVRYSGKEPTVLSVLDLGPFGFPMNGCGGRKEDFRREAGMVVVVWPQNQSSLVEQRVPWDGKVMGKPEKDPVKVADCGL